MIMKPKISKSFQCTKTLESVYTGGQVEWSRGQIWTIHGGHVNVVHQGEIKHSIKEEEDPVLCFTLLSEDVSSSCLVTAHKSGLVRIWNHNHDSLEAKDSDQATRLVRSFRSIHTGSIGLMRLAKVLTSTVLATGGSDGSVKVWDLTSQYYTHNFRTSHNVCTVLNFHPTKLLLYAGWVDGAITCWDLSTSKLVSNLEAHFSAVTSFTMSKEAVKAVSSGRDSVLVIWDLESHTKLSTVPVFSPVEGLHILNNKLSVILATEQKLSIWKLDGKPSKVLEHDLGSVVTRLMPGESDSLVHVTTSDHNLLSINVTDDSIKVDDTVVGDNDQVLALTMMTSGDQEYMVVACNSPALRLYTCDTWRCKLFPGHSDTVLCLDTCDDLLVTGSKDNCVRVWRLTADGQLEHVAVGSGHTQSVGGVAWVGSDHVTSVSADTCLKMWTISGDSLVSVRTEIAHEKDINCVTVSPDSSLIVTGSQDKTAKLWRSSDLSLVSVLRGHTRGVWCAQFSPTDNLVATGGGDAVIRIWNLKTDGAAVQDRQLEGHEASVLTLSWQSGGQLVSGSSDGLIKVWWVARQEATVTLDLGEAKVWTLHTQDDVITAGGDGGRILQWKDDTEQQEATSQEEQDRFVVQHQKLSNLIHEKNWSEAIKLALRLSQPLTALKIIKKLPREELSSAVENLDNTGLDQLLGYIVKWNQNTRHSSPAQNMLNTILTRVSPDKLLTLPNIQTHVEQLLPFTEKHYNRLQSLNTKTKFIPYMLHAMKATNVPVL